MFQQQTGEPVIAMRTWRRHDTAKDRCVAAEALSIHVQTLRAYVRSGKLPALRLAGERAIRIRRQDLETVLEPLIPSL